MSTFVVKRDGRAVPVNLNKIMDRLSFLASRNEEYGWEELNVDPFKIAQNVISGLCSGVKTSELDIASANFAQSQSLSYPDYGELAARLCVSNHEKNVRSFLKDKYPDEKHQFIASCRALYENMDGEHPAPLIPESLYKFIKKNEQLIAEIIDYRFNYNYDFIGFKILQNKYLRKVNHKENCVQTPQDLWMLVSLGIHCTAPNKTFRRFNDLSDYETTDMNLELKLMMEMEKRQHAPDLEAAFETYSLFSQGMINHATPTLYNVGSNNPSCSSCFLTTMKEDSLDSIYETVKNCALISKASGGIGIDISKIRASGAYIAGTNGQSTGLLPMLKVFNDTSVYVDQGGGGRKGAFSIYVPMHHADIREVMRARQLNFGKTDQKTESLFYGNFISDEFMKRAQSGDDWYLMCPKRQPGLYNVYGDEFSKRYNQYVKNDNYISKLPARTLMMEDITVKREAGIPYTVFKDNINRRNNQSNLGTILLSNLCTEIVEYTDGCETAVCNLASIVLNKCIINGKFNYKKLHYIAKVLTRNLNKVIDINLYPTKETERSNYRHRPIGIGVQGLADVFMILRMPFDSKEARELNIAIFETIYHGALEASCELAAKNGPYLSMYLETKFGKSPISQGILNFDMWDTKPSDRWDWDTLRSNIKEYGVRNSLLIAPMPTVSTSTMLGNVECFEPIKGNIFNRRTGSGKFTIVNKYLVRDLIRLDLWDENLRNELIRSDGSIQQLAIPMELKMLYKTAYEIGSDVILKMAADRAPYVDQAMSTNLYIANKEPKSYVSAMMKAWKYGLKSIYYIHGKADISMQQSALCTPGCDSCGS